MLNGMGFFLKSLRVLRFADERPCIHKVVLHGRLRLRFIQFLANHLDMGGIYMEPTPRPHLAALDCSGLLNASYKLVKVALIHARYSFTSVLSI